MWGERRERNPERRLIFWTTLEASRISISKGCPYNTPQDIKHRLVSLRIRSCPWSSKGRLKQLRSIYSRMPITRSLLKLQFVQPQGVADHGYRTEGHRDARDDWT